ncbi:MAG: hypothetical protein HUJ22_05745 [Gracilimonas sp.]|uniref:hypothetical protein n=1 Tax=Gracilimonas sp. TaxID=1974203 RepID=UPI0019C25F45|nr:hypothetical protein [Gracilimonas sp.]MBD3616058.1 hypothetical protein [Gracilimonas sp.]
MEKLSRSFSEDIRSPSTPYCVVPPGLGLALIPPSPRAEAAWLWAVIPSGF